MYGVLTMEIYKRNCPKCNKELETKNKHYYNKAVSENKLCISCSLTGRQFSEEHKANLSKNHANVNGGNNPFYNKRHSDETKELIGEAVSEKYKDPELRRKVSEIRKEWHKHNENSFKGRIHSDETKELLSFLSTKRFENEDERDRLSKKSIEWHLHNDNPFKGKQHTEEVRIHMRKLMREYYSNHPHPWTGRNHSDVSKEKMRDVNIARVKRLGLPFHPSYNRNSIPILEEYARENGYTIKHAENGGEYQIPNTTFYVDAYDVENNVVIEYDEVYHQSSNNKYIDKWRQDMIGNILKCKFIRILYNGEIRIFDYSKNKH
jgi:hypothetical protein